MSVQIEEASVSSEIYHCRSKNQNSLDPGGSHSYPWRGPPGHRFLQSSAHQGFSQQPICTQRIEDEGG